MAFYNPNEDAFDPSTYEVLKERSFLPRARRQNDGVGLSQNKADAAFERYMELAGGQDDYSQAQMQALTRSEQANMDDRLAIAAQYAGPKFSKMEESYLKRAMAGREPTRVGNAMIGPDGTVVSDPAANRTKQAELQFRLGQYYSQSADRDERRADRDERLQYARGRHRKLDASRLEEQTYQRGRDAADDAAANANFVPDVSKQTAQVITPGIDFSEAAGFSGAFVNSLSKIGDALGGGNPDQANRIATNALKTLAVNTKAVAASAFGGKDSVRLLDMIEEIVINPNKIFSGSADMESKAKRWRSELRGAMDVKLAILSDPIGSTKGEISKARTDYLELHQLDKEYEALLKSLPSNESDILDNDFNEALDTFNGLPQ